MPGETGATVVTNSRVFYFPREAAGALAARHSPRPLGAKDTWTTRAQRAAGYEVVSFVMAGLRPGHPRLPYLTEAKTWMPGTRPGMTTDELVALWLFEKLN
jgi:hypothetical protein